MSERPATRQELYDRIRMSSRDEIILEEMIRLGFWTSGEGQPAMTEEWIRARGELGRELGDLIRRQKRYENRDKALTDMRKQRMAEAKQRREETKQRRERERQERAARWTERKASDILYLGDGVSAGLNDAKDDAEKMRKLGLPAFADISALATAMGLEIGELRFLAFHRRVSKTTHYRRFLMPKKSGGERLISAPMPRLKRAQHWLLQNLLQRVPVHDAAHGFTPGRSIVSNALPHVGRDVVINMDLRNFFPTVSYKRTKGLFRSLGYSEKIATVLGLLCTEPDVEQVELDGETYFVQKSDRHLPQGAPTSPAITNVLCRRFDQRMRGTAEKLGFTYTRYADDLTFSASGEAATAVRKMLWRANAVIKDEGFIAHPDKLRIMRRGARQEVTGLVVNEKLGIPRDDLRRFRTLIFQIEKDGIEAKTWRGSGSHILACVRGYAHFIHMVDPEKARPIYDRVEALLARHGWQHEIRHPKKPPVTEAATKGRSFWDKLKFWKR